MSKKHTTTTTNMKALILSPYFDKPGGVAMYFNSIKQILGPNFTFFFRGNRNLTKGAKVFFMYLSDYARFALTLVRKTNDVYLVNTSFGPTGCYRDQVYILLLKLLNKKVVVFFHGWDKKFEAKIEGKNQQNRFPIKTFKKVDMVIVLADDFKNKLVSWGFKQPIFLETTVVDSSLTSGIKRTTFERCDGENPLIFLFIARIEREKGIFEAIDLFDNIQKKISSRKFIFKIAGDGSILDEVKKYVDIQKIENIEFLGYVSGEAKKKLLESSHIFLFPTKHGEGMPISLLEAMAFGLPLLTTQQGGIKDFFEDSKMGIALPEDGSINQVTITRIEKLINDKQQMDDISMYNFEFAKGKFYSEVVANRLINILFKAL